MEQKQIPHRNTKPKKNQKPLKVVYISNPIRVTASAANFRGIVQELTGRDSDIADILARQPLNTNPAEPCDAFIPTHRPPPELGEADEDKSFKLTAERFGGKEDYFASLLPHSMLFDMEY